MNILYGIDSIDKLGTYSNVLVLERNGSDSWRNIGIKSDNVDRLNIDIPHYIPKELNDELSGIADEFDCVVAIGGGSVIDLGKILAHNIDFIAIPTTGSGSAVTSFSVIFDGDIKSTVKSNDKQRHVIIDKEMAAKSNRIDLYIDALVHAIESQFSRSSTEKSRHLADNAVKDLMYGINNKDNIFMIRGSLLAGLSINIASTNIAHALSYYITKNHNIPHGVATSRLLGPVLEYCQGLSIFDRSSWEELIDSWNIPRLPRTINWNNVVDHMNIERASNGPKNIDKQELLKVLEK